MARTRLAPSPTGALHLGNARTFMVNWALARQQGWEIVLRIEDLDGPRIKPQASAEAIDILEWLGINWDLGPLFQRGDLAPYREGIRRLADGGHLYPCRCTRREIEKAALSAPHGDQHELRYPGTCRGAPLLPSDNLILTERGSRAPTPTEHHHESGAALRICAPNGSTTFVDNFVGTHSHDIQQATGDFLVATKNGFPSYQLAVVVDDHRQGIDRIVRGDDLLTSTHRQYLLWRRLSFGAPPQYWHLPLVEGPDGRRLAKRHGDSRIVRYRELGVTPERIIGLIAEWCGMGRRREMTADKFLSQFDISRMPTKRITFTHDDDAWLCTGAVLQ